MEYLEIQYCVIPLAYNVRPCGSTEISAGYRRRQVDAAE